MQTPFDRRTLRVHIPVFSFPPLDLDDEIDFVQRRHTANHYSTTMTIETLPYRHRYAKEIAEYRPGIIDRILTRWRKVGKPWDGTQSHAVNWYYDPTSPDDFVCCLYPLPSDKPQP